MKHVFFLGVVGLFLSCSVQKTNSDSCSWVSKIQKEHPRLFFNKKSFEQIRERAINEESGLFAEMKNRVDAFIGQKIEFKNPLASDGTQNSDHEYGTRAAEAAFVYLVLKDKQYLELTKKILTKLVDYYNFRNEHSLNIQWYAFSRIHALAAYDWIYHDLTEKERTEIGSPFLKAINDMLPSTKRKPVFRDNVSDTKTGFYGSTCLPWYTGVVFYNEGINDSLSKQLLLKGYDDHIALLSYRSNIAGDDGGAASAVLGYCVGEYPWAELNFFHTFHSATGLDISKEWPYVPGFINYIFWNWLPGNKEFGYGDARHYTNDLPIGAMHVHLSQMVHFYRETQPELITIAKWMQTKVPRQKRDAFPFTRFLLTNTCDELKPEILSENLPNARLFENMGQVFLRSGSGNDDTYALFTAGGILEQHRHYDNNNFVIFKKGFLALDAGTRPQPGLHLSHYYARTIAHNCMIIRMPGEIMPKYWDSGPGPGEEKSSAYPNDGGQNNLLGSKIIAFDEKADYIYVASDATQSYSKDKTNLVIRQFVFLPPDIFVIFDRVNATKAEYPKTWLLHTAKEPVVTGYEFHTRQGGGMLFCKTVFPENAKLTKIGGPGKQFWSDGKNWPLPQLKPGDWNYAYMRKMPQDTCELLGQWRMEVSPGKPATEDIFLHLIQVGDTSLTSMVGSKLVKTDNMSGVAFIYRNKEYEVMFTTQDEPGGKISISQGNRRVFEESFTNKVKPQKGLF
jgi:heparin/heparan-sulfate lyase